ncbi:MAG TPA: hypothetical protein VN969_36005 [Streptosporangiaceae bacterium]|nr:hypothetical protein [Streptosporangiaceae bacterium]
MGEDTAEAAEEAVVEGAAGAAAGDDGIAAALFRAVSAMLVGRWWDGSVTSAAPAPIPIATAATAARSSNCERVGRFCLRGSVPNEWPCAGAAGGAEELLNSDSGSSSGTGSAAGCAGQVPAGT